MIISNNKHSLNEKIGMIKNVITSYNSVFSRGELFHWWIFETWNDPSCCQSIWFDTSSHDSPGTVNCKHKTFCKFAVGTLRFNDIPRILMQPQAISQVNLQLQQSIYFLNISLVFFFDFCFKSHQTNNNWGELFGQKGDLQNQFKIIKM